MTEQSLRPEQLMSSELFEGFLLNIFDHESRQPYIVEIDGRRRIDFAEREPYDFKDSKTSDASLPAAETSESPEESEPETQPRLFARIEESLQKGAHPSLQLVVLENDGQATRSLFRYGPNGYTSTATALAREEADIVVKSESVPQAVSADEFQYALEALFATAPAKTLSPEDAQYFATLDSESEYIAESATRTDVPSWARWLGSKMWPQGK